MNVKRTRTVVNPKESVGIELERIGARPANRDSILTNAAEVLLITGCESLFLKADKKEIKNPNLSIPLYAFKGKVISKFSKKNIIKK